MRLMLTIKFTLGLSSLVELDLANNFLQSIPIAALSSLDNLKFLNLGSNKIKVIISFSVEVLLTIFLLKCSRVWSIIVYTFKAHWPNLLQISPQPTALYFKT